MSETLERLSEAKNFQQWSFGRIAQAMAHRDETNRRMPPDLRYDEATSGPWDDEPDKVQWIDPETNLDCLVLRNYFAAWCGYVGVPPGHPFHGIDYGTCRVGECDETWCTHSPIGQLGVHGGITFSDFCAESEEPDAICHAPAPGRPDNVYWFGFDCAHAFDLVPGMARSRYDGEDTYRDLAYVVGEVEHLAKQLALVAEAGHLLTGDDG